MFRFLSIAAVVFLSLGCQHRPFSVLMRGRVDGDMNMNGNMNVTGDTRVDGNMRMTGNLATSVKTDNTASRLSQVSVGGEGLGSQRIAVIDVDGLLVNRNMGGIGSMGENPVALFREKLRALENDPSIVGLVLRIDSPGGGVTATDIMSHELSRFKEATGIPVTACLMSHGTGGAYYLATHADSIVAHPTSVVGGIGVILNLYNMEDALGQYNIAAIPVKSGEMIDGGSPVRTMQQSERTVLQEMADAFHDRFKQQVSQSRAHALPKDSVVFDGRVWTGQAARELGLVDQVGYLDDAVRNARERSGADPGASIVMLRRDNDRAYTLLDITPNASSMPSLIPLNIPGLDRSKLPTFMYLWQIEPSFSSSN